MKHLYKVLQLLKDRRFDKVCSRGSLSLRLLYLKGLSLDQREKDKEGGRRRYRSSTDVHQITTGKVDRTSLSNRLHEARAI